MVDPVTVGTLAVTALSLAGEAIVKGAVGEVVKDAYAKLKALVSKRAPDEVRLLDAQPGSEPRRSMVVEVLDALPRSEMDELVEPSQQLVELLEAESSKHPIGVDISRLSAMNLNLKAVRVSSGIGVLARDVKLQGDLTIDLVDVGGPLGKTTR